ncbi:MAG: ABC transporter ATP-binding protein [Bacteroidetes bacterium]|nr:ABC transporter ATP-binding protein [Bacteroidota bacterium]MBI3482612.1 ABC transporter ATP-binding protein [Bacteroidota bacterium]
MNVIANNLGKRFNREWVFRNFNYEFESGKTYAITGPNGSGKSTLMQVLWGQMHPSEGSVDYLTSPLSSGEGTGVRSDQSEVYKSVSIAAPYMDLIDEFTLEEMVRFHFKFKKSRLPIEVVIEKIGLNSSNQKIIASFSSGMRQRLKLALAFYSESDLLFLDEPCTNLDKKSMEWYVNHLEQVPSTMTVFIASNQEHEYPSSANKIDILVYKQVTSHTLN